VVFDECRRLHEHAATSRCRIKNLPVERLDDFDDQLDDAGGCEELAALLPLRHGELAKEIFVNLPEGVSLNRHPRGYKKTAIGEVAAHYSLTPTSAVVNDGSMIHGKGQPIGGSCVTPTAPTAPVPLYRQEEWATKFNDVSRALAEALDEIHARCDEQCLKNVVLSTEISVARAELSNLRCEFEVAREKLNAKVSKLERLWILRVFAWLSSFFE